MVALIFALVLTVPVAITLLSAGFTTAVENLAQNRTITVFLNPNLANNDAQLLATTLAANAEIQSTNLAALRIRNKEVLAIDIQPTATLQADGLAKIVSSLSSHSQVDYVDADIAWLQKNISAVRTTKSLNNLSEALAVILTIVLVIAITCIDLRRRQPDYHVLNQMGVSRSTLLRPLLLRSLLLTMIALSIGTVLVYGALASLYALSDISSYWRVQPDSPPLQWLIWLPVIAGCSCYLSVNILCKRIQFS